MLQAEIPTLLSGTTTSQSYNLAQLYANAAKTASGAQGSTINRRAFPVDPSSQPEIQTFMSRRIIRTYIVDRDENVPLEKSILHKGPEELTDLTDQELYFGIPVKSLLDAHNEFRKTVLDKKATAKAGKDVFLEPIKIRDLTMNVVTIAAF